MERRVGRGDLPWCGAGGGVRVGPKQVGGGDKGRGLLIAIDPIWDRSVRLGGGGGIWDGFGRDG